MNFIGHHVNVMALEIVSMESTNQIVAEALERHRPLHDELQPQGNFFTRKVTSNIFPVQKASQNFFIFRRTTTTRFTTTRRTTTTRWTTATTTRAPQTTKKPTDCCSRFQIDNTWFDKSNDDTYVSTNGFKISKLG